MHKRVLAVCLILLSLGALVLIVSHIFQVIQPHTDSPSATLAPVTTSINNTTSTSSTVSIAMKTLSSEDGCPRYPGLLIAEPTSTFVAPTSTPVCAIHIHPDLGTARIQLITNASFLNRVITKLIVTQNIHHTTTTQTLFTNMAEPPDETTGYLTAMDFNFDGYQDLRLMTSWGATGNHVYSVWLYDPVTHRFVYNNALSQLNNIDIDLASHTIQSHGNSSADSWGGSSYRWENNTLVLIEAYGQDYDLKTQTYTCTKVTQQNGKMVTSTFDKPCAQL